MLNPSTISSTILIFATWSGAFLVALWVSLIFWVWRDIKARSQDAFMRILAVLVVGVLFLPGIVIYFILRPRTTLEEEYQKTLEEEALLRSLEEKHECPGCSRHINEQWIVCPDCHTRLKKACHHCGKLMELHWNLCPHCSTPAPGMRKESITMDEALRPSPFDDGVS